MPSVGTITWWGASGVELSIGDRCLLIDPYLHPAEARAQYICVTREDHDHCHEPTLERLVAGPAFERMIVPPSCTVMSTLDTPVAEGARDLAFVNPEHLTVMYPKYVRKPGKSYPGATELRVDGFHIEGVESNEADPVNLLGAQCWGKRYKPETGELWPAGTGRYVGGGEMPPLGYVIEERETGLTFYHPGDLQDPFDSQRRLRGRVDYMFLPLASLEGVEISVVDNVRPRYVIPIHYRSAEPDFPIPLDITEEILTATDLGRGRPRVWANADVYRRELHAMIKAHWYPSPPRALDRLANITTELNDLGTKVLVLRAGSPFELQAARA